MNYLNTRTVSLFTFWLILLSVILHVVNRDLLGLYPDYHLTSSVIMTVIGSLILTLPFMLTGKFQPILKFRESETDRRKIYSLSSLFIIAAVMGGVATAIHYSGLLPLFDVNSALYTLWVAGIMFLAVILVEIFRGRKNRKQSSHSPSPQEGRR